MNAGELTTLTIVALAAAATGALLLRCWQQRGAAARQARRDELLAVLSHEMRTPLHGIQGMVDVLREQETSAEQGQCLENIRVSAAALLHTAESILAFTRMRQHCIVYEAQDCDVGELVFRSAHLLAGQAQSKGLELIVELGPNFPAQLSVDTGKLQQILVNLLGNAIKFTESGHVKLFVNHQDKRLNITVADTGIGIAEHDRQRIFQPYIQADSSSTRRYDGIGIGLTIVRQFVELANGTLTVDSALEQGTVFFCSIPAPLRLAMVAPTLSSTTEPLLLVAMHPQAAAAVARMLAAVYPHCEQLPACEASMSRLAAVHTATVIVDVDAWFEAGLEVDFLAKLGEQAQLHLVLLRSYGCKSAVQLQQLSAATVLKPLWPRELFESLRLCQSNRVCIAASAESPVAGTPVPTPQICAQVLFVDDNPLNRQLGKRLLEKLGCSVRLACDGEAAVKAVEVGSFDLVLLDCHMPVMNGFEAAMHLCRLRRNLGRRLPIVAMTALDSSSDRERATNSGMDAWIPKPLTQETLCQVLCDQLYRSDRLCNMEDAAAPIFDQQAALQALEDDAEFLREVLQMFIENIPVQLRNLEAALANQNHAEVTRLAHSIRGAAANVRAQRIALIAADWEQQSQIGLAIDKQQALLSRLQMEFSRFQQQVSDLLTTTDSSSGPPPT